jgi:hypothetical protein
MQSAAKAHERAMAARDPESRRFFLDMEASWRRLASGIEHVERTNDFLRSAPMKTLTGGRCWRCQGIMWLKLVEVENGRERRIYECTHCGREQASNPPT